MARCRGRLRTKAMISATSSAVTSAWSYSCLDALPGLVVGDVVGQLGRDDAGLDDA